MLRIHRGTYYLEILICLLLIQTIVSEVIISQVKSTRATRNAFEMLIAMNESNAVRERLILNDHASMHEFIVAAQKRISNVLPSGLLEFVQYQNTTNINIYWGGENSQTCQRTTIGNKGCYRSTMPAITPD